MTRARARRPLYGEYTELLNAPQQLQPGSTSSARTLLSGVDPSVAVAPGTCFVAHGGPDGLSSPAAGSGEPRPPPVRIILAQPAAVPVPSLEANPGALGKGPVAPSAAHCDAITAMAWVDLPARMLLTGSRDGVVKIWR